MNNTPDKKKKGGLQADYRVLIITVAILLITVIWAFVSPDSMSSVMNSFLHILTWDFGWLLLAIGFASLVFCLYMAFGPYRNIKMGKDTDKPKYSYFSWFCMVVACGYACSLVYWGAAEPLTHFANPITGVEAYSVEAAERALALSFFHYGWIPWAIYMTAGIPIGYLMHRKGYSLKFGEMLKPIFGKRAESKAFKFVDGFVAFGIVGGAMCSAGIVILQLCSGIEALFGIPKTPTMIVLVIVIWCCLYTYSTVSGLDKGIKILSNSNITLCMIICAIVFIFNDPLKIMNMISSGLGTMLDEFMKMSFGTDIIAGSGVPQDWTAYYWVWFFAGAIPTGMFAATISKGRTFKEFVIMHLCAVPILTWTWFGTFGTAAISAEMDGLGLVASMAEKGKDTVAYTLLGNLPDGISFITQCIFVCLVMVFLVTTVDSYSYSLAQIAHVGEGSVPTRKLRAFWAILMAVFVCVLLLIGEGEIVTIQSATAASIVVIVFVAFLIVSMFITMRKEEHPKISSQVLLVNEETVETEVKKSVE